MRILGIDPGSTATGFGVVERSGGRLVHVAHGTLRPPRGAPLAPRLAHLHGAIREVVAEYRPDVAVVEQVFVAASPRSALVLGQARGAVLAAVGAAGLAVIGVHALAGQAGGDGKRARGQGPGAGDGEAAARSRARARQRRRRRAGRGDLPRPRGPARERRGGRLQAPPPARSRRPPCA